MGLPKLKKISIPKPKPLPKISLPKVKPVNPKAITQAFKKAGEGIKSGVVNSAKGIASAGKTLGKCKPGDAKCIAKGMTGLATSVGKMAIAVSPAGVTLNASDAASGGKVKKGLIVATKAVIGVNPNDLASGDPSKMGKTLGKALYKVSGAETAVTAGKALSKCKPNDAKCIAMNVGQLAGVAAAFVPGVGGAAAVATKVGQNAVKNAIKEQVIKVAEKNKAVERLKAAVTPDEKKKAKAEADKAEKELQAVNKVKAEEEKKLNDAVIVLASQTAAKAAQDEIDKAKKNPDMKDVAAGVEAKLNQEQVAVAEGVPAAAVAGAQKSADPTVALASKDDKSKPLKYILGFLAAVLAFVFFFA
jgi:hypothetical protein